MICASLSIPASYVLTVLTVIKEKLTVQLLEAIFLVGGALRCEEDEPLPGVPPPLGHGHEVAIGPQDLPAAEDDGVEGGEGGEEGAVGGGVAGVAEGRAVSGLMLERYDGLLLSVIILH